MQDRSKAHSRYVEAAAEIYSQRVVEAALTATAHMSDTAKSAMTKVTREAAKHGFVAGASWASPAIHEDSDPIVRH